MRKRTAACLALCAALVGPAAVSAQTNSDTATPGVNDLVRGFLTENAPGYLPEGVSGGGANTSTALTSYGGESQHDAEKADGIIIEDTFTAVINPTGMRGFGDFGEGLTGPTIRVGDATTPGADNNGGLNLDETFGERIADGSTVPPTGPLSVATLDDLVANLGKEGVDFHVLRTMGSEAGIPIDGPVIVQGIRVQGSLPLTNDCSGDILELGGAFHLSGGNEWPLNPTFSDDPFIGASDAIVGRCRPGVGWYVDSLRNNGSNFLPLTAAQSSSIGIVNETGMVLFTNASALPGAWGIRNFAFTTPENGGYSATNTAHTVNVFPGFRTADTWPTLVGDPFPGYPRVGAFPLRLDFSGSNDTSICGPNEWSDRFELHVEDGSPPYTAKLYQLASGQFTAGSLNLTEAGIAWMTEGGNSAYTEGFMFNGTMGTYEYRPSGSVCPLNVQVASGWDAVEAYGFINPGLTAVTPPFDPVTGEEIIDSGSTGSGSIDSSGNTDIGLIDLDPVGPSGTSSDTTNYLIVTGGATLIGAGYLYERRRKGFQGASGAYGEPASSELTIDDLTQYNEFGTSAPTSEGRQAATLTDQRATEDAAAVIEEAEATQARIQDDAARAAALKAQLLDPPRRPSNAYLTDSPTLAFLFAFSEDFENGNARDRLYTFVETVPEATEALVDNTVKSVETAYNGWGEIIDDPSKLGGIDEGLEATGEQIYDLGERYVDAASADDGGQEFARMTSHLTVNLEAMAISHKVMVGARNLVTTRLAGAAPAVGATTETAAATGRTTAATTAARTGGSVPRTTPRPPPRATVPPQPSPTANVPGYGPVRGGAPVRGGGTPIQVHPQGCGAAVIRGMLNDLGLRILPEMQLLREAFTMGVWNGTGLSLRAAGQLLQRVLPAGFRVAGGYLNGINNAATRVGTWLASNPTGQVMVGLRWGGKFTRSGGHFVRVEAVRNGFVILGDPQFASGLSIAVPIQTFNRLAEVVITVVP